MPPDTFRDPYRPPVTPQQLQAAGVDPSDFYWSATFRCWRFAGELSQRYPYKTTGGILQALGVTVDP